MSSIDHSVRALLVAIAALGITACGGDRKDASSDAASTAADMQDEAAEMAESMAEDAGDAMDAAMDDAEAAVEDAAGAVTAAPDDDGNPCTLTILAGDTIAYNTNSMSVPSSCTDVTVTLRHTGQLPAAAMGHNWVLVPSDAADAIGMAGMNAGLEGNYLPAGDDRIVAATNIIGGGESDSVTFSLADLADGTDYVYVCTFPGHWSVMKGTFTVSG